MPLLHITPSQVDIQLSRALGRMTQDLLEDGGGATGLNPEGSSGVAEEVGEADSWRCPDSRDGTPKAPESIFFQINRSVPVMV